MIRRFSPALDPRNVAAKAAAKVHRGLIQRQLGGGCPEFQRIALTVAAMAIVAADRQVHRERATMLRRGLMQRTTAVPLHARSTRGLEPEQVQDLLHRDLGANSIEVDTWHGWSSLGDTTARYSRTVPFPFSLWGTGTTLLGRSVPALPATRRATNPAGSLQHLQRLAQALVLHTQ